MAELPKRYLGEAVLKSEGAETVFDEGVKPGPRRGRAARARSSVKSGKGPGLLSATPCVRTT